MDFLSSRSDAAIRKELIGIRDSYHHYWDLLAELLQNSRDAITRKKKSGHHGPFFISISIDSAANSIEVFDNGTGINPAVLTDILAPGGGDKGLSNQTADEVGEKGVGLTYGVFSSNHFSILTRAMTGEVSGGVIENAQKWLNNDSSAQKPVFTETCEVTEPASTAKFEDKSYPIDSFTRIKAAAIPPPDGDVNIFQMTAPEIKLLLRTRTAVGVTRKLFDKEATPEFDVFLSITSSAASSSSEKVDATYLAPHTLVSDAALVTLEAARDAFVNRTDPISRRKYLSGRTVWTRSTESVDGWSINIYGVMFPDNDALLDLSKNSLGITKPETSDAYNDHLLESGIFVGTKGMPTGMKIGPKAGTGRYPAYYKRCFFFVESPHLKFDLGRKSLHYRHVAKLQKAVAQVFSRFEDVAIYQGDARVEIGKSQLTSAERRAAANKAWEEGKALPDLNDAAIRYEKHPNSQEAAVAAIFHELVGAGVLSAYRTLRTGYGEKYDVHARHVDSDSNIEVVIEFKYALESLIRDFSEKQKNFTEIDLLVAWDADVQQLAKSKFHLEASPSPTYQGETHSLMVPVAGIDPIPVILLRTLFDRRKTQQGHVAGN